MPRSDQAGGAAQHPRRGAAGGGGQRRALFQGAARHPVAAPAARSRARGAKQMAGSPSCRTLPAMVRSRHLVVLVLALLLPGCATTDTAQTSVAPVAASATPSSAPATPVDDAAQDRKSVV